MFSDNIKVIPQSLFGSIKLKDTISPVLFWMVDVITGGITSSIKPSEEAISEIFPRLSIAITFVKYCASVDKLTPENE